LRVFHRAALAEPPDRRFMQPKSNHPQGASSDQHGGEGVSLLLPMLVVFGVIVALFAGFELVEHFWLRDGDEALLTVLRRTRGILAAVVTVSVAGWVFTREGPRLLAAGPFPADAVRPDGRIDPEQKRRHYARWFILMRWVAVVVAMLGVFVAVDIAHLLPASVGPSLGAIIALLALQNLAYTLVLRYMGADTRLLAAQVYGDVFVLILLLHFSGGIENPLTPLLLLHVIIAGIVLGRAHSYGVAVVSSVLFALLGWAEMTGALPHYTLKLYPHFQINGMLMHAAHDPVYVMSRAGLQSLILLLVAYFTTTLAERIRQDERQLEQLADRALAQSQTLERALDTSGTALCLCDRELQPYWSNTRWLEWLKQAPELSCTMRARHSPVLWTLQDGAVRNEDIRVAGETSAEDRYFHLTIAPLRDRDGRISDVATLVRDVTEQHAVQARVVRAERLAAVGELAGQVAHEVNNPIAIISAKARLLLRDGGAADPDRTRLEVTKIAELADRVARISQGLLSYCRPAPGARAMLDVSQSLRRALAYVESRVADAGVCVRDEIGADVPPVHANAAELEQVFLNLLLNALDAMPQGGTLAVATRAERPAGRPAEAAVVISIADTGSGIADDLLHRVFEPFLTTKGGKGSGLGLSICQGLVRSHGGDIRITSDVGRGTVVEVWLPACDAHAPVSPYAASAYA
jgi:signal transduction histidine kinase